MTRGPDTIADELLVLRCQAGDDRALQWLYGRWQPRMARQARYLTGDQDATADLCQEAWLAIIKGMRRLRDPAAFRGWATGIVARKCADWIRARQRQRRIANHAAEHLHAVSNRSATSNEPAGGSSDQDSPDEIERIRSAMRELPGQQRALLCMLYLDEMSTREIATALDIPQGTVKSRLFHAREQLRLLLERMAS